MGLSSPSISDNTPGARAPIGDTVKIDTLKIDTLKNFVRSSGIAWPGGYQMALLMADGAVIDARSAKENYRLIRRAMQHPGTCRDWQAMDAFIHWEGDPLTCAHSGREIPSAYGTD